MFRLVSFGSRISRNILAHNSILTLQHYPYASRYFSSDNTDISKISKAKVKQKLKDGMARVDIINETLEAALTTPTILSVSKGKLKTMKLNKEPSNTDIQNQRSHSHPEFSDDPNLNTTKGIEGILAELKPSDWTKALEILERARKLNLDSIVCYEETVCRCSSAGKWRTSIDLLEQMHEKQYPLTERALTSTIICCAHGTQTAPLAAFKLFRHMAQTGIPRANSLYKALLASLVHAGHYEEADHVWNQLLTDSNNASTGIKMSTTMRAYRIESLAARGLSDAAEAELRAGQEELSDSSVNAPEQSKAGREKAGKLCNAYLRGMVIANKLVEAEIVLREMQLRGLHSSPQLLGRLLQALVETQHSDAAVRILENLSATTATAVLSVESSANQSQGSYDTTELAAAGPVWVSIMRNLASRGNWDAVALVIDVGIRLGVSIDASDADWLPDMFVDIGEAKHWQLAIRLSEWVGANVFSEQALQRALCKSGHSEQAFYRHTRILTSAHSNDTSVPKSSTSAPLCDYSVELSQSLLSALIAEEDWQGVLQLLSELGKYSAKESVIAETLPVLFSQAINKTRESTEGLGITSKLLELMVSVGIFPSWTCLRNALRTLDEECCWTDVSDWFAKRQLCPDYQLGNESIYRMAIRAASLQHQPSTALALLLELLKEHSEVVHTSTAIRTELETVRQLASAGKRKSTYGKSNSESQSGSKPRSSLSPFVFGDVIRCLITHEQTSEAIQIIHQMQARGIKPTVPSMAAVLRERSVSPVLRGLVLRELMRAGMPMPLPQHQMITRRQREKNPI